MQNNLVNRAVTALSNVGLEVVGLKKIDAGLLSFPLLKLKVKPCGLEQAKKNIADKKDFEYEAPDQCSKDTKRSHGETFDICRILRASDWRHAFNLVQEVLRAGSTDILSVGDFIRVDFDVPAASYEGLKFPARHISAKVQIIGIGVDKVIFNFDEIIFKSAINARDENEGGFSNSALSKYLNNEFLKAMGISDVLLPSNDGLQITLPKAFELFGDEEYWEAESNYFDEAYQFDYFKNEKNRVKSFENETHWYWTSSARASSAAYFCNCYYFGYSYYYSASSVGGVAPAFCVA